MKLKVKKIYLEDMISSATGALAVLRECLWDIVERVVEAETFADNGDLYESIEEQRLQLEHDLIDAGFAGELPLGFGGKSCRKSRTKRSQVVWRYHKKELVREHNVLMAYNKGDGLMYPCRVIGVGPSLPALKFAVVQFFVYGTVAEVDRSGELVEVPESYRQYVDQLLATEAEGYLWPVPEAASMQAKYWDQRYRLFSKYDHGIIIPDEAGWYSVTPEVIGLHVAKRCRGQQGSDRLGVLLDCFCGCGGNLVHLTEVAAHVVAVDIERSKLVAARHNLGVYGLSGLGVDMICADAYDVLRSFEATAACRTNQPTDAHKAGTDSSGPEERRPVDVAVLAPPWGGPSYLQQDHFDLRSMVTSGDGVELALLAWKTCRNIVYLLPRNTRKGQLRELAVLLGVKDGEFVVEEMYLNNKLKMTVAYFGPLFSSA